MIEFTVPLLDAPAEARAVDVVLDPLEPLVPLVPPVPPVDGAWPPVGFPFEICEAEHGPCSVFALGLGAPRKYHLID